MMGAIRRSMPTPLETEYKEQIKQSVIAKRLVANVRPGNSMALPEDIVSLTSAKPDSSSPPAKLRPSQPVTSSEKQFLSTQFSTYA